MSPITDIHGTDGCGGDLAAYLLGALDPQEAEAFRAHLDGCAVCREEMASLGQAVDVLPLAATQEAAPKSLRRRVLSEVRADARRKSRERRRALRPRPMRFAASAGVAALVVAAAGFGVVQLTSSSTHTYPATVGNAEVRVSGNHAELVVNHLAQPATGHIYEVWLKRGRQAPSPTKALFSVTSSGAGTVDVPGDIHGVSAVLVTQEPDGGTKVPTTAPVIVTSLS